MKFNVMFFKFPKHLLQMMHMIFNNQIKDDDC
jgi:hypothetical protein